MNFPRPGQYPSPFSLPYKTLFIALLLAILTLKGGYVWHHSFNSDEPQHLHVAWGWTQGMVQYRDYFDNHTPLFHLMMAPVVKAIGPRADILQWMRLAMLPFWALGCAAVGWLGARLYSRRAGLFAALLAAGCPPLLLCGSEFRADILWMAVWLLTVAVALCGPFSKRRAFATGLLLGACLGTSMKTTLLLGASLSAFALVLVFMRSQQRREWLSGGWGKLLALAAGLCVTPLALCGYFAKEGALPALVYCVFTHNLGAPVHQGGQFAWVFPTALGVATAGLAWVSRSVLRRATDWRQAARRVLVLLTPLLFHFYLACFWPLITRQDFLPCVPLLAIPVAGYFMSRPAGLPALSLIACVEIASAFELQKPFHLRNTIHEQLIQDVLTLTDPGEMVMDQKGETVFRPRPFYYCLENITAWKLRQGIIPDTICEKMAATRTCVCVAPKKFPEATQRWIERYYLPVTPRLRVAGCRVPPPAAPASPRAFELGVAAEYQIESPGGPVQATVDGTACNGPVFLNPGPHTLTCGDPGPLTVIWARALKKGYKPLAAGL